MKAHQMSERGFKRKTASEFVNAFNTLHKSDTHMVDFGGEAPIPMRAWPRQDSRTLIVYFHGATDRKKRKLPVFTGVREPIHPYASQLTLCDPSLYLDDTIRLAWFAGSQGLPIQQLLPPFIETLRTSLGVDRIIFTGSSGGGFAALYYSFMAPRSIAIVVAPQTNASAYNPPIFRKYITTCWPDGIENADVAPVTDLSKLYSQDFSNTVIYLQNNLDPRHTHEHMAPFLGVIPASCRERVMVKCDYWGTAGHTVISIDEWNSWLKAAIASHGTSAKEILATFHSMNARSSSSNSSVDSAGLQTQPKDREQQQVDQDLKWATLIQQNSKLAEQNTGE